MYKKGRSILQFTYDIEECIDIIREEIHGMTLEQFMEDRKTIGYIERQLEKIGEAIIQIQKLDKNILLEIYGNNSYWENIKGMRNRLIHEYWGTSVEMLYEVSIFEMEELLIYVFDLREKILKNK